ncbi:MAG: LysR family transcriptional regulator [Lachnospiraceae bacterium]|nr:LysR family transcriptional regulator [Lachnospiraceae bacterium]
MLDYRIETFLVVCQYMNFTKAAEFLNITQPAVSNHIKQLEEYYDVLLFKYEGRKIYLTREGKMLYDAMVTLHNNEIYLKEQIRHEKDERDIFRFGTTLTIGEFLISDNLERFILTHPRASVHMDVANTKELLEKLDMGDLDFAIVEGNFNKPDYGHIPYRTEEFIPVCSVHNPLADKTVTLSQLLKERLIVREEGSGTREILENVLEQKNYRISDFDNVLEICNMSAIKKLVMRDCGITLLYKCAVQNELENGEIARINIKGLRMKHEMYAIWNKDNLFSEYYEHILRELIAIA